MARTEVEIELEQEFHRFVEFGNLLDRKMRKYLVQYLKNQVYGNSEVFPELNDRYYRYFQQALDEVFEIDGLLVLAQSNDKIKKQVVIDILYWLRKSYDKAKVKNPFEEETQRLESWSVTPIHIFVKRYGALTAYLSSVYDRNQLDHQFFADKFKGLIGSKEAAALSEQQQQDIDRLFTDILAQWDALLYAKVLDFQLKKVEEEKEAFTTLISKKVEEYNKVQELINPLTDYLGWDMSRALWQETSFDVLTQYGEILEDEKSIKELADLLGKMREAEIEIQEETFEKTIIRQEWVVDETMKSEIVGVHESDDLTNMISSEASLLSDEDTELLFLKKYADQNLMTFRYEDRKLIKSEDHFTEINQRVKQKEKGPFIICVDTSESMEGRPEQIAKVLCLGILKMAIKENRKAYLINFSRGVQTLNLHDIANSIDEVAAFLAMSFYGGTDATLALYEAIKQLKTNDYEDADVLMVSDFIMYKIEDDVVQQIKHFQQNKNTQFHSLTLSADANDTILDNFDTNWVYNPKQKGIIKSLTNGMTDLYERY